MSTTTFLIIINKKKFANFRWSSQEAAIHHVYVQLLCIYKKVFYIHYKVLPSLSTLPQRIKKANNNFKKQTKTKRKKNKKEKSNIERSVFFRSLPYCNQACFLSRLLIIKLSTCDDFSNTLLYHKSNEITHGIVECSFFLAIK